MCSGRYSLFVLLSDFCVITGKFRETAQFPAKKGL